MSSIYTHLKRVRKLIQFVIKSVMNYDECTKIKRQEGKEFFCILLIQQGN